MIFKGCAAPRFVYQAGPSQATFIRFENATYALTAGHVVKDFRASVADPLITHFPAEPIIPSIVIKVVATAAPGSTAGNQLRNRFLACARCVLLTIGAIL
jgi:hypothetical protein